MTLGFVWYWGQASETLPNWRDGLRAALELLAKKYTVKWYLDEQVPDTDIGLDAILVWGDSNCPFLDIIHNYSCKKGIILTTNPHNPEKLKNVDIVFCESSPVYEEARRLGLHAVTAFGTDTDFFTPDRHKTERDIENFYPATFSPWKRQSSIAKLGSKLLCVGTVQPDGEHELEECKKHGVTVEIGYFPAEKIRDYYRRSKHVVIPAIHGSERTVLESMSSDILPTVNPENYKAHSYITEYNDSPYSSPRDFVVARYNAKQYADKIMEALL